MERVGHLLYLLLFFNAESQLILMIHFITAGKFWSIIKFQTDGQTRGGGGSGQHTAPLHFNNKRTSIRSKWMYLTLLNSRSPKIFPICHPWSVNYHTNEILMMKILNYTFFSTQQIIH